MPLTPEMESDFLDALAAMPEHMALAFKNGYQYHAAQTDDDKGMEIFLLTSAIETLRKEVDKDPIPALLTRIADALDRAYPIPWNVGDLVTNSRRGNGRILQILRSNTLLVEFEEGRFEVFADDVTRYVP